MRNFINRAILSAVLLCFYATSFASDFSQFAGGGSALQPAIFFPTSTTYTIPVTGTYRVSVEGGGGSGAACLNSPCASSGGGGGGFAEVDQSFISGTVLTITVGAGGAGIAESTGSTCANGNAGGTTSVTA